mmetsp:Transcript_81407/g.170226  ORF Transcript_81407/g.170226 Transcript_81407/m.170226 type:complete len:134 (-) Transcript_81407:154-555(-)
MADLTHTHGLFFLYFSFTQASCSYPCWRLFQALEEAPCFVVCLPFVAFLLLLCFVLVLLCNVYVSLAPGMIGLFGVEEAWSSYATSECSSCLFITAFLAKPLPLPLLHFLLLGISSASCDKSESKCSPTLSLT